MPPARARALLALVVAAVVAIVVAVVVLRPDAPQAPPVDAAVPGPVLLVPGYGGATRSMDALAGALRTDGRTVVVVDKLGDGTGDLEDQAGQVDAAAREAIAGGAPSVDVVGYSAGGVIARVWLAGIGADVPVRRVVTLGAPHAGTELAALAASGASGSCPAACQQLAPGSDLLRSLPATPGSPTWTSVWSDADEVVTPASTSGLDGAVGVELQAVCPRDATDHGGLPRTALPVAIAVTALGGEGGTGAALQEAPVAADCGRLTALGSSLLG